MGKDLKGLLAVWPIVLAVVSVTVAGVRADAKIDDVSGRVDYIYSNGPPVVEVRLARIEERQTYMAASQERIEHKMDEILAHDRKGD